MSYITCTRKVEFDAAHRVMEHESKCKYLHGHRYVVEVTFEAPTLDSVGRVIDFGVVKTVLGQWIDDHWDHTAILWEKDKILGDAVANITTQRIYYLPYNPTAENMAHYLLEKICPMLFPDIRCVMVKLWETPNCSAQSLLASHHG